jgi:hypothetical protein
VDVPAGYLALEPWSLHKTGGVGLAAIIEESRTNAYLDSYFAAADITAAWASDGTLTRSTDVPAVYGTHAAKVVLTGGTGDSNATKTLLSQERPYSAAQNVTTSAWVRGSATGLTVQRFIEAVDASNAVLGTVTANITLGTWERGTLTYANLPTGTVKTRSGIRAIGVDENDTVTLYASAAQSEVGSFATSYIPTTTAAVTRNADDVRVPTDEWNADAGTFVGVGHVDNTASSGRTLVQWWSSTSSDYRWLQYWGSTGIRMLVNNDSTLFATPMPVGMFAANSSHTFAGTWQASTPVSVYIDGGQKQSSASALPASLNRSSYDYATLSQTLHRLVVYDTALTGEQLAAADMTTDLLAGLDTARVTNEVTL